MKKLKNEIQDPAPELTPPEMIDILDNIVDAIVIISTKLKFETLCEFHRRHPDAKKKIRRNKKASKVTRPKKHS